MMSPRNATFSTLALLLIVAAPHMLSASTRSHSNASPAALAFVNSYDFETDLDREHGLFGLSPIENLRLFNTHENLTFYYFPTSATIPLGGHVAFAVIEGTATIGITDVDSFNQLVAHLELIIDTPSQADLLVRDYLLLYYIHASIFHGVEGGLNLLSSVDDIEFDPSSIDHEVERATIEHLYQITPPSVHKAVHGFIFEGFSWQPYSGLIRRHAISISSTL